MIPAPTGPATGALVLERLARHAPVALRMIDVVTGLAVIDGLDIEIAPSAGGAPIAALPSRGGVWTASGLPGLRGYEFGPDDSPAARIAAQRPFRITVRDPAGRYLPFTVDALLPPEDLVAPLPAGAAMPVPPWSASPLASPPGGALAGLPLFAAPARIAAAPIGAITADLREAGTGQPAAWALLQATIDGVVRGVGLADERGRVQLLLPYPPPPARRRTSPPAPAASRWMVELTAFYRPAPSGAPPLSADLAAVLAQFASPRRLLADAGSPPIGLPPLELDEGVPLVARSFAASPFLFLEAA